MGTNDVFVTSNFSGFWNQEKSPICDCGVIYNKYLSSTLCFRLSLYGLVENVSRLSLVHLRRCDFSITTYGW